MRASWPPVAAFASDGDARGCDIPIGVRLPQLLSLQALAFAFSCTPSAAPTAPATLRTDPSAAPALASPVCREGMAVVEGFPTPGEAFCLDVTEVTVAAYAECVAAKKCGRVDDRAYDNCTAKPGFRDRANHPITCVTGVEAEAYCRYAGKRLPSNGEHHFATFGPERRKWPWGAEAPSDQLCWAGGRPAGATGDPTTCAVGSHPKGKGPFGHLDLMGNAWEWVTSASHRFKSKEAPVGDIGLRGGPDFGTTSDMLDAFQLEVPMAKDAMLWSTGMRCASDLERALPAPPPKDATDTCPADMARVAEGSATLEAGPVAVSSFCLDRTEVTVEAYGACVAAGPCGAAKGPWDSCNGDTADRKQHPVNCLNFNDAERFCKQAGKRLPTIEELWLATAAEPTPKDGCSSNVAPRDGTCRVGGFTHAGQHHADLVGNVWEWSSSPAPGKDANTVQFLAGTTWGDAEVQFQRSIGTSPKDATESGLGFRCAR